MNAVKMVGIVALSNYAVQFPINDWLTWGALTYPVAFLVTDLTIAPENAATGAKVDELYWEVVLPESEATHFLDKNVERFRHTCLEIVLALDDGFVNLGPASDIIRLDRQHLLQGVGGTVSFQCPDLHLTETLTTELRLTTQRLLRDKRVGPDAACVDLVVHQVVQLEHVHDAHGHILIEGLAGTTVE